MAKRNSSRRPANAAATLNRPAATAASPRSGPAKRRRPWTARLLFMILGPLLFLLFSETVLRLFRYGYPTTFFLEADAETLTTNPKFAWQFYPRQNATAPTPLLVKRSKPAGTKRVVVLGESAAAGTPDPAYSFSRILDLMVQEQFPNQRVEIINAAMRGIDSHIVLRIAGECAQLAPDLFLIYTGNNDMIGLHSPDPGKPLLLNSPPFIAVQHAAKRTKLAQLFGSLLQSSAGRKAKQDMDFMRSQRLAFDDPRREPVYGNYRRNLEALCKVAARSGARALVCTVAVNLHDQPPLQSLHRRDLSASQIAEWDKEYGLGSKAEYDRKFDEAVTHFRKAAEIDDHFAELLFRLARCEEANGKTDEAKKHFSDARDWDALQFRTDSRINGIVRDVAAHAGTNLVRFVDMEKALAASALAINGVPGSKLFQEHVHFWFEGDYEVASTLLPEVAAALGLSPATAKPRPSRDECAQRLAYTPVEAANILSAVAQMTAKAPFLDELEHTLRSTIVQRRAQDALQGLGTDVAAQAQATYKAALARRPDDWMLHYNYARLLTDTGQHGAALPEYERVAKMFPQQRTFRHFYGVALLNAQRPADAAAEFKAVLKIDPDFGPAREALARVTGR